ncbi:A/G-specific adenine glycosylase [Maritalea mediterranea]|nr:A/G-specific adenine glycosylase [Maritalea mediterranea]
MHEKISKTRGKNAPTLDAEAMLEWYDRSARTLPWRVGPQARAKGVLPNPYFVWLSEIMLQQTTVPTVGKYFAAFTSQWPTIFDLAAAPRDDVLKAWAGLGYYARARNLHACAQVLVEEHNGIFPASAEELQKLPGIGPYTSAAIAAICFDEQVAVVDGNVDRVVARYTALDTPVRDQKPFVREVVARSVPKRAGDFAQSLMDLGATICAPKRANCLICPIAENCAGRKSGAPENYPVAAPKKPKPQRFGHAFVVQNQRGDIFLRQRPEKGLLAAMTEVPGSEWVGDRTEPEFPFAGDWHKRGTIDHVFTHFALEVTVWFIQSDTPPAAEGWWQPGETVEGEALPTAFKKVLQKALK